LPSAPPALHSKNRTLLEHPNRRPDARYRIVNLSGKIEASSKRAAAQQSSRHSSKPGSQVAPKQPAAHRPARSARSHLHHNHSFGSRHLNQAGR
jgi:hypothetical protein